MPKGIFTQGVCVLLDRPASLDAMESVLTDFDVRGRNDESSESWAIGGPSLVVAYRPEVNGVVVIDTIGERWPDDMGDPKKESMIFSAWSMGHFGPFAYPGGLERAAQQCWTWEDGKTVPDRHQAFLRIRASYVFGAKGDDPVMPEDYDPLDELEFVTKLASSLVDLPGAICYYNPNGEVLKNKDDLRGALKFARANNLPPLDMWSNVRLYNVHPQWSMMDTVGNAQLDISDVEACFQGELYDVNEVGNFLRNISLYILRNGEVIKGTDTMDGPGGIRWVAMHCKNGIVDPPRPVIRWFAMDKRPVPPEILNAGQVV